MNGALCSERILEPGAWPWRLSFKLVSSDLELIPTDLSPPPPSVGEVGRITVPGAPAVAKGGHM